MITTPELHQRTPFFENMIQDMGEQEKNFLNIYFFDVTV